MRNGFDDAVFSPDGTRLITGSRTGVTAAWNVGLTAGSEIATLPAAAYFYSTAQFDRAGDHLYATGGGERVGMWDTGTWELVRMLGGGGAAPPPTPIPGVVFGSLHDVMRIAPSPDGDLVAFITDASTIGQEPGGRVRVHDSRTGAEVLDLDVGTWAKDADWSPDGEVLAVAGGDDDATRVSFVDRDGSVVEELRFDPDERIGTARFTSDGESVMVEIEPREGRYEPGVGRVEVWHWRSGELARTIPADAWWAVPSPVDDIIATAPHEQAGDQEAAVWDLRTGEKIATLAGQTGAVNQMAFSADGTRLALASTDGTARVWDPTTGDLQLTLDGHLGSISAVSFSPDGSQLATAAVDGRVRIWALDLDTLVDLAEQRVTRTLTDEECRRYLDQQTCPAP
jgi:WD40 repeat protein